MRANGTIPWESGGCVSLEHSVSGQQLSGLLNERNQSLASAVFPGLRLNKRSMCPRSAEQPRGPPSPPPATVTRPSLGEACWVSMSFETDPRESLEFCTDCGLFRDFPACQSGPNRKQLAHSKQGQLGRFIYAETVYRGSQRRNPGSGGVLKWGKV